MKFSLILTTFNSSSSLVGCLESVLHLDFSPSNYELVIVDDGSTDATSGVIKAYVQKFSRAGVSFKKISNKNNLGRIKARLYGVREASYSRIVIIDVQMRISRNFLREISQYSSDLNLVTNLTMDKYKNNYSTLFYLLRKKLYYPYWGNKFPKIEITYDNFNKISKGTGGFVTNKRSFIKHSLMLRGDKIENEDTKLFKIYLDQGEKLLKISSARSEYLNRKGMESIRHIFHRGPRFVDYYFCKDTLYRRLFLISTILILLFLVSFFISIDLFMLFLTIGIILVFGVSVLLSESLKDLPVLLIYMPLISIIFLFRYSLWHLSTYEN